jgi:hypothetical protein
VINLKTREKFSFALFFFSTLGTFILGELYFASNQGADFGKYFSYIDFFFNNSETTNHGQGVLYYYLVALMVDIRSDLITNINFPSLLSSNIQIVNFLLYMFGILGFYKLLKSYQFKTETIFLTFAFINFFPTVLEMRLLMKPEILAFSVLPWIILSFDNYFKNFQIKYLITGLIYLSIILTLKGSIVAMVGLFLFLKYVNIIFLNVAKLPLMIFSFSGLFTLIYLENYLVNGNHLLYYDAFLYDNYQYKASLNFLYHINKWDFYYFPIRNYHNNSLIGITLLEIFGDYFKLSFNSDANLTFYDRLNFFQDDFFRSYAREYASILLSLLYLLLGCWLFIKEKKFRLYIFAPFCGIFILITNAFGFPSLNFDPLVGDTFKAHYYSFLYATSFIFICALFIKRYKLMSVVLLSTLSVLSIFIMGFPKESDTSIYYYQAYRSNISPLCNLTTHFFSNNQDANCNKPENTCMHNLYSDRISSTVLDKPQKQKFSDSNHTLIDKSGELYKPVNQNDCYDAINSGFRNINSKYTNLKSPPIVNITYFLISILFSPMLLWKRNG